MVGWVTRKQSSNTAYTIVGGRIALILPSSHERFVYVCAYNDVRHEAGVLGEHISHGEISQSRCKTARMRLVHR